MESSRPTMISSQLVQKAVSDHGFYDAVPEFLPLRDTVVAAKKAIDAAEQRGGCSGCKKRQVFVNVFREFVSVVGRLDPEAATRLKRYLGVSGLVVNAIDPVTRQAKLVQL